MALKRFDVNGFGCFEYNSLTNIISKYEVSSDETNAERLSAGQSAVVWGKTFKELKDSMDRHLRSLVLQITRRCNLRCEYCAYSGLFENMLPHSDEVMSLDTIYRSIDFFMEHSSNSSDLMIIFYGGEPLTEFDNIVRAVDYAKRFARKTRFGISSNGVLIDEKVINWLNDNPEVYLTVTINGRSHDRFRKRKDGSGSLAVILNNLLGIKLYHPEIWAKQIRLMSNIYMMKEIDELREFYSRELEKIPAMVSKINLDYCSQDVADRFFADLTEEKLVSEKLADEYVDTNDPFLGVLYNERIESIHNRGLCEKNTPGYIGSCMPLSWRLFVRADGSFNMCEKVTDMLSLGDLDNGFNYLAVKDLYQKMEDFCNRRCRRCWAQRLCMFCYQDLLNEKGEFNFAFPEEKCKKMRESVESYLKMYVKIVLGHPDRLS